MKRTVSDLVRVPEAKVAQFNMTLQGLREAMRVGVAEVYFPVGTVVPDTWTNTKSATIYQAPWIVVDYRMVRLATSKTRTLGAVLLRRQASPYKLPFFRSKEITSVIAEFSLRDWLNDEGGYMAGCSSDLLKVVSEVLIDQRTPVMFFLPSLEDLHLSPEPNLNIDRLAWEYFRDTPTAINDECEKRIFLDLEGRVRSFWLRSFGHNNDYVWSVRVIDGGAKELLPFLERAFVPACVIT